MSSLAHADDAGEFAPAPQPRLALELQLFTDADWIHQPGTDFTQFRLDRGEAGVAIGFAKHYGAELRLESIRSAEEGGELGIDGDSIVVRVKRAQIYGDADAGDVHFHVAAGIAPDPWITALETDYPLRPLSLTASERLLGWPVSDLAGAGQRCARAGAPEPQLRQRRRARLPRAQQRQDHHRGARGRAARRPGLRRRLMALGKDGSVGPALVRDRRSVLRRHSRHLMRARGTELVRAYGIGDRGDLVGWVYAGWLEARPIDHFVPRSARQRDQLRRGRELHVAGRRDRRRAVAGGARAASCACGSPSIARTPRALPSRYPAPSPAMRSRSC